MITWFISDLHLQPEREDLALAFSDFCKLKISSSDRLYILGDFFDAWIGDDEDGEYYLKIKSQLRELADSGVEIFFMHGNRDFLIQTRFASECGLSLLADPTTVELAGKKVLLMHGDSLCTRDLDYLAFREQVRSQAWQATVLAMPLAQRRIMAAEMRKKSAAMNSNKAEDIMDVTPAEVENVFTKHKVDILIHGHTHRPARHPQGENRERIVLGEWDEKAWYIRAEDNNIELCSFQIDK